MSKFIDLLRSREQIAAATIESKKTLEAKNEVMRLADLRSANLPLIEAAKNDIINQAATIDQLQIDYDRIEAEAKALKSAYLGKMKEIGYIIRAGRYDVSAQINFLKQHNEPIPARRYLVCEIENNQHDPEKTCMLSSREIQTALQQGKNGL